MDKRKDSDFMILELIFTVFKGLLFLVSRIFLVVPIPDMPESAVNSINTFLDTIFSNLNFLSFFVHIDTFKTVASIAIILYSFEHLYELVRWIWNKLPVSSNM